jgi:hypothetical protein
MTGIELIAKERQEQLTKHKRSITSDVKNNKDFQLSRGARKLIVESEALIDFPPKDWNKDLWIKMCKKSYNDRLIIAGALIAAELDRLNFKK